MQNEKPSEEYPFEFLVRYTHWLNIFSFPSSAAKPDFYLFFFYLFTFRSRCFSPVQKGLKGSEEIQCEMRRLYRWDLPAVMIEKELNNSAFDYWSISSTNLLCSGECVGI
ncbi:hypothetical protein CEXT_121281 [Caerostris extrusa]|uniref:Uncharacterized protein n=1 Tax=Caerostris extrusa TaxID=172846 RepID=A0AAV4P5F5_CAEEX|nr:hypothetical protein CEXT_121281 [Caerostris extrusa]